MAKYKQQPNYDFKSQVLKTDICKRLKKIDRQTYLNSLEGIVEDEKLDNDYLDILFKFGGDYVKEARKINLSSHPKTRATQEILFYLLS